MPKKTAKLFVSAGRPEACGSSRSVPLDLSVSWRHVVASTADRRHVQRRQRPQFPRRCRRRLCADGNQRPDGRRVPGLRRPHRRRVRCARGGRGDAEGPRRLHRRLLWAPALSAFATGFSDTQPCLCAIDDRHQELELLDPRLLYGECHQRRAHQRDGPGAPGQCELRERRRPVQDRARPPLLLPVPSCPAFLLPTLLPPALSCSDRCV